MLDQCLYMITKSNRRPVSETESIIGNRTVKQLFFTTLQYIVLLPRESKYNDPKYDFGRRVDRPSTFAKVGIFCAYAFVVTELIRGENLVCVLKKRAMLPVISFHIKTLDSNHSLFNNSILLATQVVIPAMLARVLLHV